ncbi:hypothetical protein HOLleu_35284 [Holothuria leucospilota]|uniref:Uncharacterized protein n=1 Tax=Holothuria leucospilota TaxID=206669 RepID=A0A9Q1BEU5_HOLLE|nr:hypothetical protein HOLleu_35284 [Holothuria leucospilota]
MAFCSDIASFVTHEVFPHCEYKCALKLFGVREPFMVQGWCKGARGTWTPCWGRMAFTLGNSSISLGRYVIQRTVSHLDDLLDFARRRGRFFNKNPKFANFPE